MQKFFHAPVEGDTPQGLDLARVLLLHTDLASRLALQTILRAGGYEVDGAATPAEALCKLDEGKYDLVLSDADLGTRSTARNVLAYARVKDYRPATAVETSYERAVDSRLASRQDQFSIHTEN